MANYSLLVTPTFKPRTFAEMAVPYQMYGEYYNALESSLSTLESALADMEKLKQFEGHEKLYQQYQDFADQLNTYSDKLASGDLKGLRSNIRTAAKDYVKNIFSSPLPEGKNGFVFVTMGAGDNWKLGTSLIKDFNI